MGQNHHHHHHHPHEMRLRKLIWVTLLNLSITIVQIIGGVLSNSLSLISDAIHNLGDSSALFIAFIAGKRSLKKPNDRMTFGYKRIEIIAALFNAIILIGICLFLFFEAYKRFLNPEPINAKQMFIVAIFGLLANLISVVILHRDKKTNLNIKAAYLHLIGDTLSSVAVIIGGLAIWIYDIYWLDPVITVLVAAYIIKHTWNIVTETVEILMQANLTGVSAREIKSEIEKNELVSKFYHIHLWKLDDNQTHIEACVSINKNIDMIEMMKLRKEIETILKDKFHLKHILLQIEYLV
ncbi:MAG: cation diffusion facilitator family transporter [Marinifilaceae bacterium]|jgi:cobalt-zinc-cadmium efflux system protein|nr:cation diffusion facilitator family transporter [Marinifilaceae bacterium]